MTILQQTFKTTEGVQKRARFENAHSTRWRYRPVRFIDGHLDQGPIDVAKWRRYTWKLQRQPYGA